MARDYKHRVNINDAGGRHNQPKRPHSKPKVSLWKWLLIVVLITAFAVFLFYLRTVGEKQGTPLLGGFKGQSTTELVKTEDTQKTLPEAKKKSILEVTKRTPKPPEFTFYTILPEKEVIVADHEIKTRAREERVGKTRDAHYVIQAGSFKVAEEADQLSAKLALMGIESRIHKAKVGNVVWFRVKIGPYARLVSVNTVMSRLQQNGMRPVITEIEN
jgi:cell division protein FtsN